MPSTRQRLLERDVAYQYVTEGVTMHRNQCVTEGVTVRRIQYVTEGVTVSRN